MIHETAMNSQIRTVTLRLKGVIELAVTLDGANSGSATGYGFRDKYGDGYGDGYGDSSGSKSGNSSGSRSGHGDGISYGRGDGNNL